MTTSHARSIFISYTHEDERYKKELEQHLSPLLLLARVSTWNDRDLKVGSFLFEEIRSKIEQCDIILLLISSSYLASSSCQNEMQVALSRHKSGISICVPVIVRPCRWDLLPLGDILAAPEDGHAVSVASDRDIAWVDVVSSLTKLIGKWTPADDASAEGVAATEAAAPIPAGNNGDATHWVYRKSENDVLWDDLKEDLQRCIASELDLKLTDGKEYEARFWGNKLLVDIKHPKFASTKRLIIEDASLYTGYTGYQLLIYPGSPLGLKVQKRTVRWMRDGADSDFLVNLDGRKPSTISDLAADIAKQAADTPWGKASARS